MTARKTAIALVVALSLGGAAWYASRHRIEAIPPQPSNPQHALLVRSVEKLWAVAGNATARCSVVIVPGDGIDSASLGDGKFVLWEGVADLPGWAVDAVAAHEVAHDSLGHARHLGVLQRVSRAFSPLSSRYSKEQELAADFEGIRLLRAAGYAQAERVMARALQVVLERQPKSWFLHPHPRREPEPPRVPVDRAGRTVEHGAPCPARFVTKPPASSPLAV